MGYDDVIARMGEFGRFQRRTFFVLCIPAMICAFHEMGGVFLGAKTDFRCLLPDEDSQHATFLLPQDLMNTSYPWNNETRRWSQCERYDIPDLIDHYYTFDGNLSASPSVVKCDSFVYDKSQYTLTTATEFNLVCDKAWLRAAGDSVFMVGVTLGSIVFAGLADKWGRKSTLFLVLIIQLVAGALLAVSPNFIWYMIFRLLIGSSTNGVFLIAYVIALEMVSPKTRLVAEMGFQLSFSCGYILITALAYYIRNWRNLQIAFAAPSIIFLGYWWLIPESIRWLLTTGRLDEAKDLLQKVSLENGQELSRETLNDLLKDESESYADLQQSSAIDLVRYPNMRKKSLLIFFIWFVNACTYFGLSWNTSDLGGNEYVNFGISAAVEVPAYLFLLFTLDRWGRKVILCSCLLLAGTAMLCTMFVPADMPWMIVVLAMIGKFAISSSSAGSLVFASELFPTVIRNVGLGASSISARIGGVIAPYINLLSGVWRPLPLAIFGIFSLIAGVLILLLPETLHQKLPESIEDGEQFGKKIKPEIEKSDDLKIIKPSTVPDNKISKNSSRF